jgi:tetratricopeptide (TPR) repeat protein
MNTCENDACYANISDIMSYFKRKSQSGFLFCSCNNQAYIKQLNQQIIERAKALGLNIAEVYISYDDRDTFPDKIREAAEATPKGIIVNNLDELIFRSEGKVLREINFSREILIDIGIRLLFWLSEENISRFANNAPDFFIRRDRNVIRFADPTGQTQMRRLEEFYDFRFKEKQKYEKLRLTTESLERQLEEAKNRGYSDERIAKEIVADLISIYLEVYLRNEAFELFKKYENYLNNSFKHLELLADLHDRVGKWDKAIEYYLQSEQIKKENNDRLGLGKIYTNIGRIYRKKGDWRTSLDYLLKSEKILLEPGIGCQAELSYTYNSIGLVYSNRRQLDEAIKYFLKAEEILIEYVKKSDHVEDEAHIELGYTYNNISIIYTQKGEWDQALKYCLKAEQIMKEIGALPGLGWSYNGMALIYYLKDELDKALEYHVASEKIMIEINDRPGLAWAYRVKALIHSKKKEWKESLDNFIKSEKIMLEVGIKAGLARNYNNIGAIFDKKSDWDKALGYYLKSEKISLEVGDRAGLAYTYFNIGTIYLEKKDNEKANRYLPIAGYLAKTLGMKHGFSQMEWALTPLINELGEGKFMELGKKLYEEKMAEFEQGGLPPCS